MKRILICEDEKEVQLLLRRVLKKGHYKIYSAENGKEAIDKTKEIKPDLILLDIRMPKIDGLEVAKKIRKFDTHSKIIFITGFESPQLQQEAIKYDIYDYIVKPASSEKIIKTIHNALGD